MLFKSIILLSLLSLAGAASASQNQTGNPTYVYGMGTGAVLFIQTGGSRDSVPSCATSNPDRWAFDTTNVAGQTKLSILLTAKGLNKTVQVYGTGTCSVWGDTETVDYLVMNN